MDKPITLDGKLRCLQSLLQQVGANVACEVVSEARDALAKNAPPDPFGWWVETQGEKPDDTASQFVRDPQFIDTLRSHGLKVTVTALHAHTDPATLAQQPDEPPATTLETGPARIPTRPRCARCHRYITIDTDADDDLWAEVIGERFGPGYICADCFTRAADERLIRWEGRLRLVPYSLAQQTEIQARSAERARVPEHPLPMDTAPRDGTMLRLLVQFDEHATEDTSAPAWTIGANEFDANGNDEWRFAGWCWTHDHFTEGKGTPVGWLPMLAAAPSQPEDAVSRQCDAIVEDKGYPTNPHQCSRKAKPGSTYCAQHGRGRSNAQPEDARHSAEVTHG